MKLRALTLTVCLVCAPSIARCEAPPLYGGQVVASLHNAPHSMDPLRARSHGEITLASLVFDSLYALDKAGKIVPHLAEALPRVSANGGVWSIPLRRGVTFHDGRFLRPQDVVASLRRAQHVSNTSWALAGVTKISRVGFTIVLTVGRPTRDLEYVLAMPQLAITPRGRPPSSKRPIGSGPFAFEPGAALARTITLRSFVTHFAGRPYIDSLRLRWFTRRGGEARAYEAGKTDVSLRGAVAFSGHTPKYPTGAAQGPATTLVYLGFGNANAAIDADRDFRRGVSLAIARAQFKHVGAGEQIVPALRPETSVTGGLPPSASQAQAQAGAAKLALARAASRHPQLLRVMDESNAKPFELIVDNTRLEDAEVAGRVVTALSRMGVPLSYTSLSPSEFAKRVAASACDLYIGELVSPSPRPLHGYAAAFAAGGDKWASQLTGATVTLPAARAAFDQRLPIVPLFHRALRAHHRTSLRSLAFGMLGQLSFADAYSWNPPKPAAP